MLAFADSRWPVADGSHNSTAAFFIRMVEGCRRSGLPLSAPVTHTRPIYPTWWRAHLELARMNIELKNQFEEDSGKNTAEPGMP